MVKSKGALVDARQMARDNPRTFKVPSRSNLSKLRPGKFVKVAWTGEKGDERFWLKLTEVDVGNERFAGAVDSDLVLYPDKFKPGKIVRAHFKNAYGIM
jgi:hypothetical protein